MQSTAKGERSCRASNVSLFESKTGLTTRHQDDRHGSVQGHSQERRTTPVEADQMGERNHPEWEETADILKSSRASASGMIFLVTTAIEF